MVRPIALHWKLEPGPSRPDHVVKPDDLMLINATMPGSGAHGVPSVGAVMPMTAEEAAARLCYWSRAGTPAQHPSLGVIHDAVAVGPGWLQLTVEPTREFREWVVAEQDATARLEALERRGREATAKAEAEGEERRQRALFWDRCLDQATCDWSAMSWWDRTFTYRRHEFIDQRADRLYRQRYPGEKA
jgi:hypothetical protein